MKIRATVVEVSDTGDTLCVKMQGGAVSAPDWAKAAGQTVNIPITGRNKRAFHVGREVEIIVKPKG